MDGFIEGLAKVGISQPGDEINHIIGEGWGGSGNAVVGDAVFYNRDPPEMKYYDSDCAENTTVKSEGVEEGLVENTPPPPLFRADDRKIFMPETEDYNAYARASRRYLTDTSRIDPTANLDDLYLHHFRYIPDRTLISPHVLELEDAFCEFMSIATTPSEDAYDDALQYLRGAIGEIEIPTNYIVPESHHLWKDAFVISTTLQSRKKILASIDVRQRSAMHLRALLNIAAKVYHFVADYEPHVYVIQNMGTLKLRYTASTLVLLYDMSVVVRMIGRAYDKDIECHHGWFGMRSVSDFVDDITRKREMKQIVYKWENAVGGCDPSAHQHGDNEWTEKMAEPLDSVMVYSGEGGASSRRHIIWFQTPKLGETIDVTNIRIKEEMGSVDVQFFVQLEMPAGDDVIVTAKDDKCVNLFDGSKPLYGDVPARITIKLPVARKEYEIHDLFESRLVVVEPSAMINVHYRYYSDAFVMLTYRVVKIDGSIYMQLFDIRFSSEDATLALQASELLRAKLESPSLTDSMRDLLMVRLALFCNIGRVYDDE